MACQICGKYSGYFPLCKECNKLKDEGEVVKCDDCGTWHYVGKPCECESDNIQIDKKHLDKNNDKQEHKCLICDTLTKNKYLCSECYKKVDSQTEIIDKNNSAIKLKDYYFNLKNYIYRIQTFDDETLQFQLSKLYAIADISKRLYSYDALFNKVIDDIQDIKESKAKKSTMSEKEKEEININVAGIHRTKDGHFVKSEGEIKIDDILFDLDVLHVYEKKVTPITERTVVCDWYVPVFKKYGIYIELWGIDSDKRYNINKDEKRALYKKHNLPLIEIEKDELKGDSMGLIDRIDSEIEKYKEKIKDKL